MTKKGKMIYAPPKLLDEIDSIMKREDFHKPSYAIDRLVKYSQVGMELEKINPLMWKKRGKKK